EPTPPPSPATAPSLAATSSHATEADQTPAQDSEADGLAPRASYQPTDPVSHHHSWLHSNNSTGRLGHGLQPSTTPKKTPEKQTRKSQRGGRARAQRSPGRPRKAVPGLAFVLSSRPVLDALALDLG